MFNETVKCIVKNGNNEPKKITIKQAYEMPDSKYGFRVYHEGGFVEGVPVREPISDHIMYRLTGGSGLEFVVTEDHTHLTLDGEKRTDELNWKDFLTINFTATKEEGWDDKVDYYVKINNIEKLKNYEGKYLYSFIMKDDKDPHFTLANGLVTHDNSLILDRTIIE